jgi:hypothetical protein
VTCKDTCPQAFGLPRLVGVRLCPQCQWVPPMVSLEYQFRRSSDHLTNLPPCLGKILGGDPWFSAGGTFQILGKISGTWAFMMNSNDSNACWRMVPEASSPSTTKCPRRIHPHYRSSHLWRWDLHGLCRGQGGQPFNLEIEDFMGNVGVRNEQLRTRSQPCKGDHKATSANCLFASFIQHHWFLSLRSPLLSLLSQNRG